MSDEILYEVSDQIATITTNRPERYNSLNYEAYRLLSEYMTQADADPEVRVIIWTGNGRGFCTGDDVKELLGEGAAELSRRIATGELELPGGPMLRSTTAWSWPCWPTSVSHPAALGSRKCSSSERSSLGMTALSYFLAWLARRLPPRSS